MYRFVDHTADIAFEVEAESLANLIKEASMAFYDAFTYIEMLDETLVREIEISEKDPDRLLFSWLNELLYLFDAEHFAGKKIEIVVDTSDTIVVRGKILGDWLNPEKVKLEPKAITLHNFKVEKRDGRWYAFVIVDI